MCLILDANKFHGFVNQDADMLPVKNWIDNKGGKIAYSPTEKFEKELNKTKKMKSLFDAYRKSGKIKLFDEREIEHKKSQLSGLTSDDPHIIALAQVANVKLLVSGDKNLHADFKNEEFIKNGKVYQTKNHSKLLSQSTCP